MNRKQIKKQAKHILKNNYGSILVVCLIGLIFIRNTPLYQSSLNLFNKNSQAIYSSEINQNYSDIKSYILNNDLINNNSNNYYWDFLAKYQPTDGIISSVYNSVINSRSIYFAIFNLGKHIFKGSSIFIILFLVLSILFGFLIKIFIQNLLFIGQIIYFISLSDKHKPKLAYLLSCFHQKKGYYAGFTIFLTSIFQTLWNITIIGGIIKHYSYYLVPFIVAENPSINSLTAINLSRKLMNGYKWEVFKFDLSFIGWKILNIFTFNILDLFFITPYYLISSTQLYQNIKHKIIDDQPSIYQNYKLDTTKIYLTEANQLKKHEFKEIIYPITNLIIMFFVFSIFGWLWEVSLGFIQYGIFVNRGTLFGPWLPIYGSGALLMLVLLKKFNHSISLTFALCFILSGILEYSTATILWFVYHLKWWDYTGYFLNIQGRICFEGLLVFSLGGVFLIYAIAPSLNKILNKYQNILKKLCLVLIILFIIDFTYSTYHPNEGKGITDYQQQTALLN